MIKRMLALLLSVMLMVSLLPMSAMAAEASIESEVNEAVSEMIKDYAKKVYQTDADDDAFSDFFVHAYFGGGKKMTLSEKSPMTASLFNSCLLQEALTKAISAGILKAQELRRDRLYGTGSTNWHNYLYSYYSTGYLNKGEAAYTGSVGKLIEPTVPGEMSCHYTGAVNENDEVQTLLTGGLNTSFELGQIQLLDGRVTYSVTILLKDTFDFTGSYDDVAEKGYNTSKDENLKNLGWMMTFMGIDEFDWEFKTTLQVEVPSSCDHSSHNYHWVYDMNSMMLINEKGDGFEPNEPIRKEHENKTSNSEPIIRYYYDLDKSVMLMHDRPWVMEWEQIGLRKHQFDASPVTLYAQDQHFVFLIFSHKVPLGDGTEKTLGVLLGVKIADRFKYYDTHRYTTTLENIVSENGTNMFYLSIYDHDLGETVLSPEPMDDLYYKLPEEETQTRKDKSSQLANGMDIIIHGIGNKSCGWLSGSSKELELRVWENGKNPVPDLGVAVQPTCTKQGGMLNKCSDCGCEYLTDVIPALGHSYGEYAPDGNTTCTDNGTKTRFCTRCGETDTVTVEESAPGHAFTDYSDDGNRSCTDVGTKTRSCTVCGETETVPNEGTAVGHDFGLYSFDHNATCTADGTKTAVCKTCGEKDTVPAEGSATGHLYEATVTAPTCTAEGFTTYTCSCGDSYVDDRTAVTEHAWDAGTVTLRPTLTTPGSVKYTCTLCGKTKHMSIDKLPAASFTDVPADAYYAEAVAWAKSQGITSGITDTLFGSDMGCTRGQVVTFLWAAAGKPEPRAAENPFTDVTETDYFYKPVLWAVENGITGGIGEGLFGPNESCTRGQIVTFLWASQNKPEVTASSDFADVADTDWYAKPVIWAAENKVTGGIGEGMFGPNNTCTRGQVVTFLYKVYSSY